tara:strand:+ start:14318 stop:14968 length:651 start_codon:yes stop_codon:yes gene_type:complete
MVVAIAAYEVAEIIRRSTFVISPFSGEHAVSGHATRGAIRLALILEREASRSVPEGEMHAIREYREGPGLFGEYAARMKNELVRSLGRFPRERASILILEASMIRIMGDFPHQDGALHRAFNLLEEAEAIVLSISATSRLRLRFLLERAKLHRELGRRLHRDGIAHWKQQIAAGQHDLASLQNLASQLRLPLWESIAIIQLQKLEEVSTILMRTPK